MAIALLIKNVPVDAEKRTIRKAVACAIKRAIEDARIDFKISIWTGKGAGKAKLLLPDETYTLATKLLRLEPPAMVQYKKKCQRIFFEFFRQTGTELALQDDRIIKAVSREDVESDYEEDTGVDANEGLLCSSLGCGAWSALRHFIDAWSSKESAKARVTVDGDAAMITVRQGSQMTEFNVYDVDYFLYDIRRSRLFITVKALPIFYICTKNGYPGTVKWSRSSALDDSHGQVAPYAWVYCLKDVNLSNARALFSQNNRLLGVFQEMPIHDSKIKTLMDKKMAELLRSNFLSMPFATAFQAEALIRSWHIIPLEFLSSPMQHALKSLDPIVCAQRLMALRSELGWRGPLSDAYSIEQISNLLLDGDFGTTEDPQEDVPHAVVGTSAALARSARLEFNAAGNSDDKVESVMVHTVTVSPAGMQLAGPFADPGNRVIRQYPGHDDYYLRVSFIDESGARIRHSHPDKTVDMVEKIVWQRFFDVLRNGLMVSGHRFEALAFSSSQLKSHSMWFVRSPFILNGSMLVTADSIRRSIGNLTHIKCAPRYAARLGQAFTTTLYEVPIKKSEMRELEDVCTSDGKYVFSDGVGTVSQEVVQMLNRAAGKTRRRGRRTASVFQIRLDGAKGVIALDPRLPGRQVCLRKSMIKFQSSNDESILAVAQHCTRPLPCYLNRPLIALLESIGVPKQAFINLQAAAIGKIKNAARNCSSAARLINDMGLGKGVRLNTTITSLINLFTMDPFDSIPFMRDILRTAIVFALRQLKYRARIPVPKSHNLMGIMDETGLLNEDEIYVCLVDGSGHRTYLRGSCLVYRSPTLHPGDVQIAQAHGSVPLTSALYQLTNCVVFSQKGQRPLTTMLAGGDLDGDLYSVVQESSLFPNTTYSPAGYEVKPPAEQEKPVSKENIMDFFLDFMVNDEIGSLANNHLILSDQSKLGVLSDECLLLAEIHNVAIDYPKTGRRWEGRRPGMAKGRPDYLETEDRVEPREDRALGYADSRPRLSGRRDFYRSDKVLGELFRNIRVSDSLLKWGLLKNQPKLAFTEAESSSHESRLISPLPRRRNGGDEKAGGKIDWWPTISLVLKPRDERWTQSYAYHRELTLHACQRLEAHTIEFMSEGRSDRISPPELFLGCVLVRGPHMKTRAAHDAGEALQTAVRGTVAKYLQAACSPSEATLALSEASSHSKTPSMLTSNGTEKLQRDPLEWAKAEAILPTMLDTGEDFEPDEEATSTWPADERDDISEAFTQESGTWEDVSVFTADQSGPKMSSSRSQSRGAESAASRELRNARNDLLAAEEVHRHLFSLFHAAVRLGVEEAAQSKESKHRSKAAWGRGLNIDAPSRRCSSTMMDAMPWIVFPRLVRAKKAVERLEAACELLRKQNGEDEEDDDDAAIAAFANLDCSQI